MARAIEINTPQFQVPVVSLPSPGAPAAEVLGTAVSAASNVYDALEKRQLQQAHLNSSLKLSRARAKVMQELDDDFENNRVDDGYPTLVDERMGQLAQDLDSGAESEPERVLLAQGAADIANTVAYPTAHAMAARAAAAKRGADMRATGFAFANAISKKPELFDKLAGDWLALVETQPGNPEEKAENRKFVTALAAEHFLGMNSPTAAIEAMKDPKWDKILPPSDRRPIIDKLEEQRREQYSNFDRAHTQAEKERREQSQKIRKAVGDLVTGGQYEEAKQLWQTNKHMLEYDDSEAVAKFFGKGPGQGNPVVFGPLYVDALLGRNNIMEAQGAFQEAFITEDQLTKIGSLVGQNIPAGWFRQGSDIIAKSPLAQAQPWGNDYKKYTDLALRWRQFALDNKQATDQFAMSVLKRMLTDAIEKPSRPPEGAVLVNGKLDLKATRQALDAKYLKANNGDVAAKDRDQNFLAQLKLLKRWSSWQANSDSLEEMMK